MTALKLLVPFGNRRLARRLSSKKDHVRLTALDELRERIRQVA